MPLGVTLSLRRRLELLDWASKRGAWVLEDDYDSEFRYSTRPLACLQGIDPHGCVILVGTFSKVLSPALRLGYMVVPPPLVDVFADARWHVDFCPPYLEQAVLADFIGEGHFERHIRRMRATYQMRRKLLVSLLRRELADGAQVDAPDAGMNLILWLPRGTSDVGVTRALAAEGIDALPISACSVERRMPPGLLLGYSGVRPAELREGATRLARVLREMGAGTIASRRSG
jgi:GntR family transcriptional regulator/MocR family aminotransferase